MGINDLGLMPKTVAILQENGIATFDDLLLLDDASLNNMKGLSQHRAMKVRECIEKWRETHEETLPVIADDMSIDNLKEANERTVVVDGTVIELSQEKSDDGKTIRNFLNNQRNSDRNSEIFAKYFGRSGATLEEVAIEYGLTRERVRQICNRYLEKIKRGFKTNKIDPEILATIDQAAEERTEISMVNVFDGLLGKEGVVRVVVSIYPERFDIIRHKRLNGEWLVKKNDNIKSMIDYLLKTLRERENPMRVEEVLALFPIKEDMLFSIEDVIEKDGYVTVSTNKRVMGKVPIIKSFLANIARPASIQEISDKTGLTLNQVRGAVADKNLFENVGKSLYDSVDANYSDLTPSELARNILIAEDSAIPVKRVVDYILRYNYSGLSERDVMIELFAKDGSGVFHADGYVLLREWGLDKIEETAKRNYTVSLKEAIMNVASMLDTIFDAQQVSEKIKEVYNGDASDNIYSVKSYLNILAKDNKIIEVGKNTGCYRLPKERE